jgi:uncharacterized membrane protein
MQSWRSRLTLIAVVLAAMGSIAYPLAVYLGRDQIAPEAFVAVALFLLALRLATLRSAIAARWRPPLLAACGALLFLALADAPLATMAYPILLSLAAVVVFGWSLLRPPSLVEQLANLRHPTLPPAGRAYCRRVTVVWTAWLGVNAAATAALAAWGDLRLWALWTGVIFYLASGLLFAGEYLVRRRVMRWVAGAP